MLCKNRRCRWWRNQFLISPVSCSWGLEGYCPSGTTALLPMTEFMAPLETINVNFAVSVIWCTMADNRGQGSWNGAESDCCMDGSWSSSWRCCGTGIVIPMQQYGEVGDLNNYFRQPMRALASHVKVDPGSLWVSLQYGWPLASCPRTKAVDPLSRVYWYLSGQQTFEFGDKKANKRVW